MRSPLDIVMLGGDQFQTRFLEKEIAGKPISFHCYPLRKSPPRKALQHQPSLIIITADASMEWALNNLKAVVKRFPRLGILMIASEAGPRDIIRAYRLGASEFILYPFSRAELQSALKRILSQCHSSGILGLFFFWIRKMITFFKSQSAQPDQQEPAVDHSLGLLPGDRFPMSFNASNKHKADISLHFLGKLEIEYHGKLLDELHGVKIASLLAYLLYHHQKPLHGEMLKAKFWGNSSPESARNSLNVALHKIRKLFQTINPKEQVLLHDFSAYRINPNLSVLSDTDEFLAHWRKGRAMEQTEGLEAALPYYNQASALYRGDFLENLMFEEWCETERDNLKETYLFILNRLSDYFFQQKSYTASVHVCRKILAKDPCIEETHQRLIICYQNLGMRDKAIRQFYLCEESLKTELSVKPSDYTRSLFQTLSQG